MYTLIFSFLSFVKFVLTLNPINSIISFERINVLMFVSILVGVIVLISILGYYAWSERKKRIALQQSVYEYEARDLVTQMNPHFLFNAINNLQGIIAQRNDKATYEYISNLNVLTSSTFTMSQKKVIPLAEELRYLNAYLTINTYRLNDDFTYDIQVDEMVIPEITFLPPLLVQPLIENAIIHGLKPLKSHKRLSIHIALLDTILTISVKDNGIGRNASSKIKKEMTHVKHSLSSKIFDRRMLLYNTMNADPITISYQDLTQDHDGQTGTVAVLKIPL